MCLAVSGKAEAVVEAYDKTRRRKSGVLAVEAGRSEDDDGVSYTDLQLPFPKIRADRTHATLNEYWYPILSTSSHSAPTALRIPVAGLIGELPSTVGFNRGEASLPAVRPICVE